MQFIDRLVIFVFVAFVILQVVLPGVTGRPLFPLFRSKRRAPGLLSQIEQIQQELEEESLIEQARHIARLRDELRAKNNSATADSEKTEGKQSA